MPITASLRYSNTPTPRWQLTFIWLALCALLFALCSSAQAQQSTGNVPRIGFLTSASAAGSAPGIEAFRQGLRELGYVEGKNIAIEYRYADGKPERLPGLAEELVRLKIDILVANSATVVRAVKKSTAAIPIVVANMGDPFGSGLVASLARPGGKVTGLTHYSSELIGKRLELLKEVIPHVSRFGFLNDVGTPARRSAFNDSQIAAKALGVQFQLVEVTASNPDFEGAFRFILKEHIGAVVTEATPLMAFNRKQILQLTQQNRIPAMHSEQEWANAGGLMSYGANRVDPFRRVASFVDKILKGAKPADLPVEGPTKFEFVINLKAAKALNLTIPQSVLYRADKVIK